MIRSLLAAGVLMTALSGCATGDAAPSGVALGQPVTMTPGQRVSLPEGATLRYIEVTDDSRCRPNVQCIRAGDANVVFEFTPSGAVASRVVVNTDPQQSQADIGALKLRVLSLGFEEAPKATVQVDAR